MEHTPTVSVVMAARNCEAYVAEAIDSIVNQTFEDWEMLVADDQSTDRTRAIIDRYDDHRIRRYHNDRQMGYLRTWNKLLQYSRGKLITWQDADDISVPLRLEKLVHALEEHPDVHLCGCNSVRVHHFSGEKTVTQYPLTHEEILRVIEHEERLPFTGATKIIRREVLQDVGGFREFFDGVTGEDFDFILRVAENYRVANIQDVLYVYRYTRDSSSRRVVDKNSFLKLNIQRAVFFLAAQRKRSQGLDGLMDGGDKEGFDRFVESLRREFERDPSIAYRRACRTKTANQDYLFALADAFRAVVTNPTILGNYLLFPRVVGSLVKTVLRVSKRRLLRQRQMVG